MKNLLISIILLLSFNKVISQNIIEGIWNFGDLKYDWNKIEEFQKTHSIYLDKIWVIPSTILRKTISSYINYIQINFVTDDMGYLISYDSIYKFKYYKIKDDFYYLFITIDNIKFTIFVSYLPHLDQLWLSSNDEVWLTYKKLLKSSPYLTREKL